jgi:hypothetical protein
MARSGIVRSALFALSLALASASLVTWPVASTTAGLMPPERVFAQRAVPSPEAVADASFIAPLRDPFAGVPHGTAPLGAPPLPAHAPSPAAYAPIPGLPILPANAGAGGPRSGVLVPRLASESHAVRAVVVGRHAFALVTFGDALRMIGVGDRIDDDVAAAIDAQGVTLASGARLSLRAVTDDSRKELP